MGRTAVRAMAVLALGMLAASGARAGTQLRDCGASEDPCKIELVGTIADKPKPGGGVTRNCEVHVVHETIGVPKGATPLVVWIINEGRPDATEFVFDPVNGVKPNGKHKPNDKKQDFDPKGHGAAGAHSFAWKSVHSRKAEWKVGYDLNVSARNPGGGTVPCKVKDPVIINRF